MSFQRCVPVGKEYEQRLVGQESEKCVECSDMSICKMLFQRDGNMKNQHQRVKLVQTRDHHHPVSPM